MPIVRRSAETLVTPHWTHRIVARVFTAHFRVDRKTLRVVAAEPVLHWTINQRYDKVRETCSLRNYELHDLLKPSSRK